MAKLPPNTKTIPTYGHPALGFKDGAAKPYRHVVDNFANAGQDSFSRPPSQDPEMYQLLKNVLVSETGVMLPRWGTTAFYSAVSPFTASYKTLENYQNNNGDRKIISMRCKPPVDATDTSNNEMWVFSEDGTIYDQPFTPVTQRPRIVNSRNYAYFTGENKKWTSTTVGSATKWGIDAPATALHVGTSSATGKNIQKAYPTILLNGWGPNAHVGDYETAGFNLNNDITYAYDTPENAYDQDESTSAATNPTNGTHTHRYSGCIYQFAKQSAWGTPTTLTLNVLVDSAGSGSGYGSVWYSTDSGTTWTQVYKTLSQTKQWFNVTLVPGTDLPENTQVMVFTDSHDDTIQHAYEINLEADLTPVGSSLTTGRTYFVVYMNTLTGHISDLSPASTTTGAVGTTDIPLTQIPVSTDSQVNKKAILATLDGNNEQFLYELVILDNSTTSYTDQVPDTNLSVNQVYLSTDVDGTEHGVPDNTPPPAADGALVCKHKGRLVMGIGRRLFFSKSLDELTTSTGFVAGKYEEAWPADFFIDLSEGAEEVRGLMSYQDTLYVASEKTVRQIRGDSPANFTKPEIIFSSAGVSTQDTWQPIFFEGAPVGTMWLTPDLRVILSDMNSYRDIGTPVQDVLDTIDQSSINSAKGMYFSFGAYSFYILAAPPNILLVYNIRTQKWSQWDLGVVFPGALQNHLKENGASLMLLTDTGSDSVYYFDPTVGTDVGQTFQWQIRTSWLDLGDPSLTKILNEIEIYTADPYPFSGLAVTVEGASAMKDFTSPATIVSNVNPSPAPIALSPNNNIAKIYLGGKTTKYRWYRLTFTLNSNS
jgi:hypothetical protein